MEDSARDNIRMAGDFFMLCQWIQSQLADLIVLHDHPKIRKRFIANIVKLPRTFREKRSKLWQKDFAEIKTLFEARFRDARQGDFKKRLESVYLLRNMIAHSHVSGARSYLFHRPSSVKRVRRILGTLIVTRPPDAAKPLLFKMDFSKQAYYDHCFDLVRKLDEIHLKAIANSLGIPHSRVR